MKYYLLDFDDTLIKTNAHVIHCYNEVSSDKLKAEDFTTEYSWDNLAVHSDLWKSLINVIIRDPSNIEPVDGMVSFLNAIPVHIEADDRIIILSKRWGKNIIHKYLTEHNVSDLFLNKVEYVLVSKNDDKITFIRDLYEHSNTESIVYFEDRSDIVSCVDDVCNYIYVQNRAWNQKLKQSYKRDNIKFFNNYNEIELGLKFKVNPYGK